MAIPRRQRGGKISAREIAETLQREGISTELIGPEDMVPTHVGPIGSADARCLAFYVGTDPRVVDKIRDCVLFTRPDLNGVHDSVARIIVDDPRLCFAIIGQEFLPPLPKPGIHVTAVIDPEAEIHPTAYVGPHCTLEKCIVGENCVIHPHVTIYANTTIGRRVEIEAGAVIGSTGLGRSVGPDGRHWLFPHFGETILEDEAFVGSCSVITRGVMGSTTLKEGCRINAGVKIAHNCVIGRYTAVSIGVTISGSVIVGDRCFIGSGADLREGIRIGNDIVVGMGSVVVKHFEQDNVVIMGNPARIFRENA